MRREEGLHRGKLTQTSGRQHDIIKHSATKRFWQTIQRLKKGKLFFTNAVYSGGGELLI